MSNQMMVQLIEKPDRRELFDNPNYSRILRILRNEEMSAKEIHKRFNKDYEDKKTLTSIYRYLKTLKKHDLVYVSREETKKGHLIESYYSRTAQFFIFPDEWSDESVIDATADLVKRVYQLSGEKGKRLNDLLHELSKRRREFFINFYKEFGDEILEIEQKYGFDVMNEATHIIHELRYFRNNPELFNRLFDLLEK